MRDTLLSRFRGAFLGTLLGEVVGTTMPIYRFQSAWQMGERGRFRPLPAAGQLHSHSKLMLAQAEALIQPALEQPSATQLSDSGFQPAQMAKLAITAIPIALLHHDQPATLHTALQTALKPAAVSSETMIGVSVVGQTLSLLLRERLVPHQLIPQLLSDLDLPNIPLVQQLLQVQTWVEQSTGLATIAAWVKRLSATSPALDSLPIVLALYAFLSTPNDFRLSLLRLARLLAQRSVPQPDQDALTCTLAGTVSGLYNGWVGVPLAWRQQHWDIASEHDLLQVADRLLAVWSGATQPALWVQQPQFANITAAPRVIRSN